MLLRIIFYFLLIFHTILLAQIPGEKLDEFLRQWGSKKQNIDPRQAPIYLATGAMDLKEDKDGTRIWIGTEGVHLWQGEIDMPIMEMVCDQAVVWFKQSTTSSKKNELGLPGLSTSDKKSQLGLADSNQESTIVEKNTETTADYTKDSSLSTKGNDSLQSGLQFSSDTAEKAILYAEGNVHFRWADHYFRGERILFDFVNNIGIVQQGNMRTRVATENDKFIELSLRAEELRMYSRNEFAADNAIISPCQFGHPHYHFQAQKVYVEKLDKKIYIEARKNHMEAMGIPFFYVPYIAGENFENWPLKKMEYGHSSRWGNYVLSTWGGNLYKGDRDEVGLSRLRWLFDVDVREDRGFAGGPRLEYKGQFPKGSTFTGNMRAYFIHDQPLSELGTSMGHTPDDDDDATWDNRHWIYAVHRQSFPEKWYLDLELSKLSDRDVLRDFFEKEFREEKEPETYAYVRKYWDHQAVTLLARWRLNDYQNQIEYMPQGTHQIIFQPIFPEHITGLYWSSRLEVSHVRRQDDEDAESIWDNERVFRTDWNHTLSYKFNVGPIQFLPFLGARLSYYDKGVEGEEDLFRRAGEAGVEVATNFYRMYNIHSDIFQCDQILHVFTPHIRYQWIYANSVGSRKLIPMDSLEQVDRLQVLEFVLTNRLRTKRDNQIVDFLWLELSCKYFPDRPDSFIIENLPTKRWKNFDNLHWNFLWYFRSNWWFRSNGEYNLGLHDFSVARASMGHNPAKDISVWFDHRYDRHQGNISTVSTQFRYNEKWSFTASVQYDFADGKLRECKGTIRRYFHCVALDFNIKYDVIDDNTSVGVQFAPVDIFQDQE